MTQPQRIDPRGPRFGAAITSVFAIIAFGFSLDTWLYAWLILWLLFALFALSVFGKNITHPYSYLFQKFVRPRLAAPAELEDPRPPHFAQQVGLSFAAFGVISGFVWPLGVTIAAAFIFLAAFLNAFFGLCLGCQMYLGLRRLGLLRQ
ncbi:DUF4395 domain-containing protein [Candidatus Aquiluna sp. UB-MaderosW2red]|jgi:hypothetical protein|uniref:DUF4395 domain-containing protein n=1 Tax=Candidatus Aquiluna sp. UB-MaderosW2red TaxID=1855377 RepID=UPI000875D50F|nr:DUF4395 domain-containing protein [Candidatus Aquiluna sp. UB-MaderosW2red]SCX13434.1 protein of unknown function [Candidatus Aquiluna sp. UB-MaderosW2red]